MQTLRQGDRIWITIKDHGPGIPLDAEAPIFERFYRVKGKGVEGTFGIGLVLYICREITEKHKGSIDVHSQWGKGTAFYFELPLVDMAQ